MCYPIRSVRPMPGNPWQSLGNSLASSRKHKRKLKKRLQVFVRKWSFVALARCSFRATSELKQGRFWATHVNRKRGIFAVNMPWHYQFCIVRSYTVIETISSKIWAKPMSKNTNSTLPVDVRRSKTSLFKFPTVWWATALADDTRGESNFNRRDLSDFRAKKSQLLKNDWL